MKFLCVPCDQPMRLERKSTERGSVTLTYACAECGYEFAMLTNPMETQLVSSLGVEIAGGTAPGASKCPFTGVARELAAEEGNASSPAWSGEAERRLAAVPDFVKPMVRTGIERWAFERGYREIDERVLEEAKGFFGME